MKKVALVLMAIVLVGSVAMSQGMAKSGQWGIQTSLGVASSPVRTTPTVGLKFMASENLAVRVEAGFNSYSPAGGGNTTTGYAFGAGFEYHMTAVGSVSPYVGFQAGYGGGSTGGGGSTQTSFGAAGVWGGEYFFSSNFSWGGEVGIGFTSTSNVLTGVDINGLPIYGTRSEIGTGSATLIATWYLN